ncbi:MAG: hypothetical protein LBQ05_01830, partial [Christensenellaceae bacterium]|nr:hypothetical protein [Christensenellaceae bacterium]
MGSQTNDKNKTGGIADIHDIGRPAANIVEKVDTKYAYTEPVATPNVEPSPSAKPLTSHQPTPTTTQILATAITQKPATAATPTTAPATQTPATTATAAATVTTQTPTATAPVAAPTPVPVSAAAAPATSPELVQVPVDAPPPEPEIEGLIIEKGADIYKAEKIEAKKKKKEKAAGFFEGIKSKFAGFGTYVKTNKRFQVVVSVIIILALLGGGLGV